MSVVKSLVGSVVGAAIATGIYYGIKQSTGETYMWFPLITGALTGIVARVLGGSTSNAASFVCGACAALIAGVAIFGVDLGPKFMEMRADRGAIKPNELLADASKLVKPIEPGKVSTPEDEGSGDADSSETDETADADESETGSEDKSDVPTDASEEMADRSRSRTPEEAKRAEAAVEAAGTTGNAGAIPKKVDSWVSQYLPYVFNGIGILFAYQIARGFGSSKPQDGKDS